MSMRASRATANDPSTPDDQILLGRIANQDPQALDLLYERYARVVYGLALRMLGTSELAEDVVQETFWRVWRRSGSFKSARGSVAGWIYGIAHNLSVDELRRQRARPTPVFDTDENPVLRGLLDEREDVAGTAEQNELQRALAVALGGLGVEQRQAIELAYFGGLSQSEIAARLQSPIGTVKTRIRSGLRRLREVLAAQHVGAEDLTE
jgi:RNA polymerase sigma-70 factor (ECF subfamily)